MKSLLFLFSCFHRLGCQLKNLAYDRELLKPKRAPIPVISIGNINFGGTEKTPLVMELVAFLVKRGLKTALISRGYKGAWERKGGVLSNGKRILGTWKEGGDEPYLVALRLPQAGIFIGQERLRSCQKAKELGFEIAVLDDGFQHRRLYRSLDIVLYNPAEKIALREPVTSLKRADILLIKKRAEFPEMPKLKRLLSPENIFEYSVRNAGFSRVETRQMLGEDAFRGKRILAFCGIARPERFISLLKESGADVVFCFKFPDHHPYSEFSLRKIAKKFHELKPEAVVTTEKDTVKIASAKEFLEEIPAYALRIGLNLEQEFYNRILSFLQTIK
jgi:tetraacyldisaccharide 4'-kinase